MILSLVFSGRRVVLVARVIFLMCRGFSPGTIIHCHLQAGVLKVKTKTKELCTHSGRAEFPFLFCWRLGLPVVGVAFVFGRQLGLPPEIWRSHVGEVVHNLAVIIFVFLFLCAVS